MFDKYDLVEGSSTSRGRAGRKVLFYATLVFLCGALGISLAFFPPLLVGGGLCAILFTAVILLRPYWGLLLYTVIFLLRPAEIYPVLAPLRLERIVGVVTLAGLFFAQHRLEHRFYLDGSKQTRLLLLFVLTVLISVPFAFWRSAAMDGFVSILKILAFYILLVQLVDTRSRLRGFIGVLSTLIAYMAVMSLKGYFSGNLVTAQGIERVVGTTSAGGDPNTLATTMAVAFPLFLLLTLRRATGWWRVPLAIGCVALAMTIAVSGSRASLLGFLAGLVCLWWISPRRMLNGTIGLSLVLVFFLLLPEQYKTRYSTIMQSELDESSLGRLDAWKAGLQMISDRPLSGVGISCFGTAYGMRYSPEFARKWLQPHNLFVQVFAELGLIGGLVFFAFLVEAISLNRGVAHRLSQSGHEWEYEEIVVKSLFVGFVVLLVSGFFAHNLQRYTWYLYAAMGLVILRLSLSHSTAESSGPSGNMKGAAMPQTDMLV